MPIANCVDVKQRAERCHSQTDMKTGQWGLQGNLIIKYFAFETSYWGLLFWCWPSRKSHIQCPPKSRKICESDFTFSIFVEGGCSRFEPMEDLDLDPDVALAQPQRKKLPKVVCFTSVPRGAFGVELPQYMGLP